jgi:hypothetical protein
MRAAWRKCNLQARASLSPKAHDGNAPSDLHDTNGRSRDGQHHCAGQTCGAAGAHGIASGRRGPAACSGAHVSFQGPRQALCVPAPRPLRKPMAPSSRAPSAGAAMRAVAPPMTPARRGARGYKNSDARARVRAQPPCEGPQRMPLHVRFPPASACCRKVVFRSAARQQAAPARQRARMRGCAGAVHARRQRRSCARARSWGSHPWPRTAAQKRRLTARSSGGAS